MSNTNIHRYENNKTECSFVLLQLETRCNNSKSDIYACHAMIPKSTFVSSAVTRSQKFCAALAIPLLILELTHFKLGQLSLCYTAAVQYQYIQSR